MKEDAMIPVLWWALVGAVAAFGVAALLSVGVFVLPVALVLAGAGLWSRRLRTGALPGLLVGASLVPFWLAVQNRAGPGEVCETTPTVSTCTEQFSPWPFLLVGLALLAAGVWVLRREAPTGPSTATVHEDVPREA
jgi:hypothetical protein